MASDNNSPGMAAPESLSDIKWTNLFDGHDDVKDLEAIVEFNDNFDAENQNPRRSRVAEGDQSTPGNDANSQQESIFDDVFEESFGQRNLFDIPQDQLLVDQHPQPVESNMSDSYNAALINRNHLRRSVSEPPAGMPQDWMAGPQPPLEPVVTFHRDNQRPLGQPISDNMMRLKNTLRARQARQKPQARRTNAVSKALKGKQPVTPSSQPVQQQMAHISPGYIQHYGGRPPTSVPFPMATPFMDVPHSYTRPFLGSRVCSPAREGLTATPAAQMAMATPQHARPGLNSIQHHGQLVSIHLTVEQLREIIVEAVREAVRGVEKQEGQEPSTGPGIPTDTFDFP